MAQHIVDKLINSKLSDFYRPNYFEVSINRTTTLDKFVHSLIQSVSLPSITTGSIPIKRMGKTINIAGNSVDYSDVSTTLYDDTSRMTREYFYNWLQEYYGKPDSGTLGNQHTHTTKAIMSIKQLDRAFNEIATTKLYNIFPTSVGELELSHESEDTVATFTVAYNYSYMEYIPVGV